MNLISIGLVHPEKMDRDARLNLIGAEELLEQEGLPFTRLTCREAAAGAPGVNVLVAVDHGCFTSEEEEQLAALAGRMPLVWTGILRAAAHPALLRTLGMPTVTVDDVTHLRLIRLRPHPLTAEFTHPKETTLRMKFVEHLHAPCPPGAAELAEMALGDGRRLGAAAYALPTTPRRVVFTFPLGKVLCVKTCLYTDGEHLDQNDFPICTIVDVLRGLLREAIRWASGGSVLVRKYYWPYRGAVPRGFFSTNHDLCGYSERGVAWIKSVCDAEGVRTTFFDFYPFRLRRGQVDGHDVCLHAPDTTSYEQFVEQKRILEETQGVPVLGWRRHGRTAMENWPRIWRDAAHAGIKWSSSHNPQTHPFMGAAYHLATGNRLPSHIVDVGAAERIPLLELSCFDTGDDDRLSNFGYGPKLSWDEFVQVFETRLDYAARHNLMASYLIHGWTAGVVEEKGTHYAALDAQRMLPRAIRAAKEHGFIFLGCNELYAWWAHRAATRLAFVANEVSVQQPAGDWTLVLEIVPPAGQALAFSLDGRPIVPTVWAEGERRRYLVRLTGSGRIQIGE